MHAGGYISPFPFYFHFISTPSQPLWAFMLVHQATSLLMVRSRFGAGGSERPPKEPAVTPPKSLQGPAHDPHDLLETLGCPYPPGPHCRGARLQATSPV